MTVDDAIREFAMASRARQRKQTTLQFYKDQLTPFSNWCKENDVINIEDVTPSLIRQYYASIDPKLSSYTINARARALRSLILFCVDDEIIAKSPMKAAGMPKLRVKKPESFTEEEITTLLKTCRNTRDEAILLVLLDTGMRASELCALNKRSYDPNRSRIEIAAGKNDKPRVAFVGARTARVLGRYFRSEQQAPDEPMFRSQTKERISTSGLRQIIERIAQRAGIEGAHPHKFRHTFATMSLRNGVDIYRLKELMGHSDLKVMLTYLEIVEEDIRAAQKRSNITDRLR